MTTYKVLRSTLLYVAESWTTKNDERKMLNIWEKDSAELRFNDGKWSLEKRYNRELYDLLGEPNITNTVKTTKYIGQGM